MLEQIIAETKTMEADAVKAETDAQKAYEAFEKQGKLSVGDEITMVSATFGDEMWSARGVGKMRLEKSLAVRQGSWVKLAFESSDDVSKRRKKELEAQAKKQAEFTNRLQKQLAGEVDASKEKKKGGLFGLF